VPIPSWQNFEFRVGALPVYNYLIAQDSINNLSVRHPDDLHIRTLNDSANYARLYAQFRGKRCTYGFVFYGGNDYPADAEGDPITFDEMANSNQGGTNKLGILRMDVDNLGSIFISGLGNKKKTFSRYSTLSRQLDYFFKGYLNSIWSQHFNQTTSIIYSGGDDLFIVGNWSDTIAFAEKIHTEFTSWVCQNSHLTISGGIAITGGKFPIAKGADFAAEAEKKSKEHTTLIGGKNAITLFGIPLQWRGEYPLVKKIKGELVRLITNKEIPRGILQKLLRYAAEAEKQKEAGGSTSWRWMMAYEFSRLSAQMRDSSAEVFLSNIKTAAYTETWDGVNITNFSHYSFLKLIEVAARWAELETKE
jgi:CRISPR-associated protein Csm1